VSRGAVGRRRSVVLLHEPAESPHRDFEGVEVESGNGRVVLGNVDVSPTAQRTNRPLPVAQYAIAAVVEGKLRGVAKDLGGSTSFEVPAVSSGDARVLVVASSHFLTNPFARPCMGRYPSIIFHAAYMDVL
jgi:hypothetical protein